MTAEPEPGPILSLEARPDVLPTGGGYRALVRRGGAIVWSCFHVHFTEHSARACAERRLRDNGTTHGGDTEARERLA